MNNIVTKLNKRLRTKLCIKINNKLDNDDFIQLYYQLCDELHVRIDEKICVELRYQLINQL